MKFRHEFAPYDTAAIARKLQTHDTMFEVVQGEIHAVISESELVDLQEQGITMWTKMSEMALDTAQLRLDFNDLYSRYDALGENVEGYRSQVASYKVAVDGISAQLDTVNSQYDTMYEAHSNLVGTVNSLSSELTGVQTMLGEDYSTTTEVQSLISQTQESILTQVSGTYASNSDLEAVRSSATSLINQRRDEILQSVSANYASIDSLNKVVTASYYQYALLDSASPSYTPPASTEWSADVPVASSGKYVWARLITRYKDGTTSTGTAFCLSDAGGKDRIIRVRQEYVINKDQYAITENPKSYRGSWSTSVPQYSVDYPEYKYIFTRTAILRDVPSGTNGWEYRDEKLDEGLTYSMNRVLNLGERVTSAEQKVTASAIKQTVSSIDGLGNIIAKGSVILAINDESSEYTINADHINFNGLVTANEYFKILTDGSMEAKSGKIGGWKIGTNSLSNTFTGEDGYKSNIYLYSNPTSNSSYFIRFAKTIDGYTNDYFSVNGAGKMTAHDSDIYCHSSDSNELQIKNGRLVTRNKDGYRGLEYVGTKIYIYSYEYHDAFKGMMGVKSYTLPDYDTSKDFTMSGLLLAHSSDVAIGTITSASGTPDVYIGINESRSYGKGLITFHRPSVFRDRIEICGLENGAGVYGRHETGIINLRANNTSYTDIELVSVDRTARMLIRMSSNTPQILYQTKSGNTWSTSKKVTFS